MSGLAWKAHLRPAVMSSDHLVLLAENRHYWLEGSAYVHAAPLLDGSRTDDEIEGCLEDAGVPSMSACFALSHLRALGLVHERPSDRARPTPEEAAFWESLGQDATAVADRLASSRVLLRDAGGTGVDTLRQAIQGAGLSLAFEPEHGDLLIAVADDYLDRRLDAINRAALESGAAWMAVKLAGAVPWIGPLFVPGTTGCWECLAQRLRLNRQTEQVIENRLGATARAPLPASESSVMLGAGLVAVEVLRWLATGRLDRLEGSLLRLESQDKCAYA